MFISLGFLILANTNSPCPSPSPWAKKQAKSVTVQRYVFIVRSDLTNWLAYMLSTRQNCINLLLISVIASSSSRWWCKGFCLRIEPFWRHTAFRFKINLHKKYFFLIFLFFLINDWIHWVRSTPKIGFPNNKWLFNHVKCTQTKCFPKSLYVLLQLWKEEKWKTKKNGKINSDEWRKYKVKIKKTANPISVVSSLNLRGIQLE